MTDPAPAAQGKPGPLSTYALTAATFLVVLMLLAWQVRAGRDPAIGAAKPATPVKRILVKRIERKVIITAPAAPAPAPAAAAPAPAAPAPAPVLSTRSS